MGSSIGGSGTVRSRGGVRATEGPLIEVQLYFSAYKFQDLEEEPSSSSSTFAPWSDVSVCGEASAPLVPFTRFLQVSSVTLGLEDGEVDARQVSKLALAIERIASSF